MLVFKRVILVVGSLFGSIIVGAQAQAVGFEVSVGLEASQNSNPDNLSDSGMIESELEYAGVFGLRGEIAGHYVKWVSDLNYEARRFSEHEEADYELAIGDADLTLGSDSSRLVGGLSYSAEEDLIDLRQGRTPDNLDFRSISAGRMLLRSRNPQNRFSVFANAANVEYEVRQQLESSQHGGGVIYQRALSPTSLVSLEFSGYALDYKIIDDASYDYYLVTTRWQRAMRKLQYEIAIGGNTVIRKEEEKSSPYYELRVDWREPANSYLVSFEQFLTDTSQGSARGGGESGGVIDPSDGRLNNVVDQYRFQEAALTWSNSSLCRRCNSSLRMMWQREDYQVFKEENNTQRQYVVELGYRVGRRLSLLLSAVQANLQNDNTSASRADYTEHRFRLSAVRNQLAKRGRLEIFAQTLSRDFDEGKGYDQDLVGLRFDWLLYER